MSATAPTLPDDTWHKVHGEFIETMIHRCELIVGPLADERDAAGPSGSAASLPHVVAHAERMRALADELIDLGRPAPLDQLEAIAGLTSIERELVALAAAFELDPCIGRAIIARFGGATGVPTSAVVADLFGLSATEIVAVVEPASPLRRLALLAESPPGPAAVERPMRLAERTLQFICGRGAIDQRLHGIVTPVDGVALSERLTGLAHDLHDWLVSGVGGDAGSGRSRVALVGPSGSGRGAVAAHVAADFGLALFAVDLDRLAGRTDRLDLARAITRELLLTPAALYVDADASSGDDPARAAAIDEAVDLIDGLVLIGTTRPDVGSVSITVDVPPLGRAERVELWRSALGEPTDGPKLDVDELGDRFRVGPRTIARVASSAAARADLERRPLDDELVRAVVTAETGVGLSALAQRVDAAVDWHRLVVGDDERALLRALCDHVRFRSRVHDDWGVGRASARGLGTSALFTGPSGTGKTLAAEVIATELSLPLYRIDLSAVVSKYIGETEKNLRRVFDAAERGGAILFFDEADALFGKRTEVKDSHDRYANIEIDYLLQRMEDHAGLSILATNRKADIDQAFLRRVRFVVPFPFPREPARREIWASELAGDIPTRGIDLDALARLELAGGNIRNVVLNAAFAAAAGDSAVTMTHLLRAADQEYTKIDKLPTRAEFGDRYDELVRGVVR